MVERDGCPRLLYFAYGSNLCVPRLRHRVPGVRIRGPALLPGFRLRWHKRSTDGSGKASIVPCDAPGAAVHGALFDLPVEEKEGLDRAEGLGAGYEELEVEVEAAGERVSAYTYVAQDTHVDDTLEPYGWYRDLVIDGAEAIGLPAAWIARLRRVRAVDDPDADRDRRERGFLSGRAS